MFQQMVIKENVRKVCDKYGKSVSRNVPKHQFMYDSKHKLLFCRNAKVINSSSVICILYSNFEIETILFLWVTCQH